MAGSSFFALIDDIATLLDDMAMMTKMAAQKTAGVLGDDLALNAQQVAGVNAERELPVVWAVAKGSFLNKLILVPLALLISAIIPWAIMPLLMVGGLYLCYEGFEKVAHFFLHHEENEEHHEELTEAISNPEIDMISFEKEKIKGAIRTDFILSAEIIVIALGEVAEASFMMQVIVLSIIAVLMTVGVYGLVGGIVKLDDAGLLLTQRSGPTLRQLGLLIINSAPYLMKTLSVLGTLAMFLVGGGIIAHTIHFIHDYIHFLAHGTHQIAVIGPILETISPLFLNLMLGILAGAIIVGIIKVFRQLTKSKDTE